MVVVGAVGATVAVVVRVPLLVDESVQALNSARQPIAMARAR